MVRVCTIVVHPNQPQCCVLTTTSERVGELADHELDVTRHEAMDANLPASRKLNKNASAIAATSELGDEGNEKRGRGTAAGELGYSMKGSTCGRAMIFRTLRVRMRAQRTNDVKVRRMRSALVRRVGKVALLVHPSGTVSDEEWTIIMREVALLPKESRMVIWAGGSINAKQRRAASQGSNKLRLRTIIFTDSMISRGVMSAMSWMGMDVIAYAKARFAAGMEAEGFDAPDTEEVRAAIANMERELADQPPGS